MASTWWEIVRVEKGNYLEKCVKSMTIKSWLPVQIIRKVSKTEYKIGYLNDTDGVIGSKLSSYIDLSADVWRKMKNDEVDQTAGRGRSGRRRKIPALPRHSA